MKRTSYWLDTQEIKSSTVLTKDLNVDVLIVGGGITGITTAYLLNKAGLKVAIIERERLASVDTGNTTAHLTYVTDTPLQVLEKDFGSDHAQATWDAGAAAIDEIEAIIDREKIECEFTRLPGYLHAPVHDGSKTEYPTLKKNAKLARALGFDATYLESIPHFGVPGIRFANQAKFHPLKYLSKLVDSILGGGFFLFVKNVAGH